MFRKLTTVFLLLLAAGSALAHGNLKFVNGRWFDGTRFVEKTMYAVDNTFRSTHDGETRVIDLGGRYVIPPLGDAHNHAFADGMNYDEQLARFLGAGIFYVKNPNNTVRLTVPYRARVNKPESVDVLYSNGGLTSTGGHPVQLFPPELENDAYFIIDTVEALDAKWPRILEGNPDFIKVYLEDNRGLTPAVLNAVVARAHAKGLRVTAHVTSTADVHHAVVAGVDELAHLPLAPIDPADAELAAKKNITVVTTTLSHRPSPAGADLAALHRANLALLKKHGVNVVLGVDNQPTVVDELHNVAKLGVFTNAELLRIATEKTPLAIFPSRKLARLQDGYEASFLALDSNPLEDLSALRKVGLRVKQGHILEIAAPKRSVMEALVPVIMSKGVDAAIAEYRRLEREESKEWDFGEKALNDLGYAMINHGMASQSIAIFALNAEKFPHSANVWDSLGEAYMKAGDRAKAIENYEKSLAINPKNENAKTMLKKLRE